MKKTIAFIIAVCMLILMCLPVLAEEAKLTKEDVMKEIEATAAYLLNGKTELTVDDATNLYYLTEQIPDAVTTELIDSFLDSVKQNLEANGNAKITKSDDTESVATYAAVVRILDMYTEDGAENFNGVDVSQLLLNSDLTTISNPYDLTIIIPVMGDYDMDKTKTLCDYYIDNFYTEGQGVDYYGYSCDNTCMFVQAIADSGMFDEYKDVIADAIAVIDTYKVEGGYCFNPTYGTEPNADSTALALMAKSTYYLYNDDVDEEDRSITEEELEELTGIYNDLLAFKGETAGSYTYGGAESAYAAMDAIKGLNSFWWVVWSDEMDHMTYDEPDDNDGAADAADDNQATDDIVANDVPVATGTSEKSYFPNTGDMSSVVVLGIAALGACGLIVSRKRED